MAKFTALDERFAHQIPEPFPNVLHFHPDWRESLFFIMHEREKPGDVLILTLAHFPSRKEMDSLQLGRVGDAPVIARHVRAVDGDQDDFRVGPITIEVLEPLKKIRLLAVPSDQTPVSFDITFTARTLPYQLRRGTMKARYEIIWDQSKPDGTPRKVMDETRIRSLGWEPTISLREGIASTLKWYRENR